MKYGNTEARRLDRNNFRRTFLEFSGTQDFTIIWPDQHASHLKHPKSMLMIKFSAPIFSLKFKLSSPPFENNVKDVSSGVVLNSTLNDEPTVL